VPDRDGKTAQLPSQKKIEGGKKKRRALFGTERVLNDDGKNDKTMALAQLKDPKDAKRFFVFFFFYFFQQAVATAAAIIYYFCCCRTIH